MAAGAVTDQAAWAADPVLAHRPDEYSHRRGRWAPWLSLGGAILFSLMTVGLLAAIVLRWDELGYQIIIMAFVLLLMAALTVALWRQTLDPRTQSFWSERHGDDHTPLVSETFTVPHALAADPDALFALLGNQPTTLPQLGRGRSNEAFGILHERGFLTDVTYREVAVMPLDCFEEWAWERYREQGAADA